MCINVLPTRMYVHHICASCIWGSEAGDGYPGTGVTNDCAQCWEQNPCLCKSNSTLNSWAISPAPWIFIYLFACVWVFCVYVYLYATCVPDSWKQKKASDPLGLELKTAKGTWMLLNVEPRKWLWDLWKSRWALSPALRHVFVASHIVIWNPLLLKSSSESFPLTLVWQYGKLSHL